MTAGGWTIPHRLQQLIKSGWWPCDGASANMQHIRPLIPEAQVRAFADNESAIFFLPPPFYTVSELIASSEAAFWRHEMACPGEISFEHSVVIGDFGLGSDAPILLDYRSEPLRPGVLRLRYGNKFAENRWVKAAEDFDAMCKILRINQ